MSSAGRRARSVSMAAWIYFAVFTRRGQVVKMTGLHPHDPGCHRASAEVSSSKTLSAHQLQAAVLQHSLPFDLILSGKVCSPFGNWRGGACYLSENTNCCVVIVWISLGSRLTPTHLFFFFLNIFSKRFFSNRCEANNQGDDRMVFKALQQHVIMSIYISARGPNPTCSGERV